MKKNEIIFFSPAVINVGNVIAIEWLGFFHRRKETVFPASTFYSAPLLPLGGWLSARIGQYLSFESRRYSPDPELFSL